MNKHLRNKLNKQNEFGVGEVLICKNYFKSKAVTFNVNFEYKIVEIMGNSLKIKNIASLAVYEVPIKLIKYNFQFNYCTTCHNVHTSTLGESISIGGYKFFFVTRKSIWTAVGRARNLDGVTTEM